MPIVKIWSGDHQLKKMAFVNTLSDVLNQAQEKGICTSEKAKVFLRDWTELEDDLFEEIISQLPLDERILVVAEAAPQAESTLLAETIFPGPSGLQEIGPLMESCAERCVFTLVMERLPLRVQEWLKAGKGPLPPKERKELVRAVVDQMLEKASRPRREFIRSVAEGLVQNFSLALQDVGIDGQPLGRGYDSVFQQLENRVENLTRGTKSQPNEKSKKKRSSNSYGCQNWQPIERPGAEDDLTQKIEFLRKEGRKTIKDVDRPLATTYMAETYTKQREFINSSQPLHTTAEVKEEWPLLFQRPFFYAHANNLLGKDVQATFQDNVGNCAPLLLKYLDTVSSKEVMFILVELQHERKKGNENAPQEALMPLLASYFKDEAGALYHVLEEGTSITAKVPELPSTPVVVALGNIYQRRCYVFCEQEALFDEPTSFSEATCLMFLIYYVLNLQYAERAATTLEFLQRQLFDINPSTGSKWHGGKKSRTSVHSKIMKLAQRLRASI